jgi:hypothetical protein
VFDTTFWSVAIRNCIWGFLKICWKIHVWLKTDKNNGTLHEGLCKCMITSRWILLKMRNVSDKSCTELQNTQFMNDIFFFENRAVYEILWKNMVQPDRPHVTILYRACALHAEWLRHKYRYSPRIFNTYCFYTARMVRRTPLNVRL